MQFNYYRQKLIPEMLDKNKLSTEQIQFHGFVQSLQFLSERLYKGLVGEQFGSLKFQLIISIYQVLLVACLAGARQKFELITWKNRCQPVPWDLETIWVK